LWLLLLADFPFPQRNWVRCGLLTTPKTCHFGLFIGQNHYWFLHSWNCGLLDGFSEKSQWTYQDRLGYIKLDKAISQGVLIRFGKLEYNAV